MINESEKPIPQLARRRFQTDTFIARMPRYVITIAIKFEVVGHEPIRDELLVGIRLGRRAACD